MELNTREISLLIWLGIFIAWCFSMKAVRGSLFGVLKAATHFQLLKWVALMLAYTAGCVWLLDRIGLWSTDNLKTTGIWVLTFGLVTMFKATTIGEDKHGFVKLAKDIVAPTAVVLFIGEFYTFDLWIELLLVPGLTLLGMLTAVAALNPEHAKVGRIFTGLQVWTGVGILAYSAYQVAVNFKDFATWDTAREFALPILLSFLFLPFLYVMIVYITYETMFTTLGFRIEDPKLIGFAKRSAVLAFGLDRDALRRWQRDLTVNDVRDHEGIRRVTRELKALKKREAAPFHVAPADGWSPYEAKLHLAAHGITTADYHRTFDDEWYSESPMLRMKQGMFDDTIAYYVEGTEVAATRLKLNLFVHLQGDAAASDARFFAIARDLIDCVWNAGDAARLAAQLTSADNFTLTVARKTLELEREDWGEGAFCGYRRRLTIRHQADDRARAT